MKAVSISLLALFMSFSVAAAAGPDCGDDWDEKHAIINIDHEFHNYHYHHDDGISLDFDDGDVVITCEKRRYKSDEVRITGDYRLYVNGARVEVDDDQRELLKKFHHKAMDVNEEAKAIAEEGATIGIEGAKIGARAVSGVLRMFFLDFDEEEFEAKIEGEAEDLEEMAEKLEARAEVLEDMAEELEDLHDELADEVPELEELKWF